MVKKGLLVLVFLFAFSLIYAQEENPDENKTTKKMIRKARDRYLGLGLGFSYMKVIDNTTSPLLYKGLQFPYAKLDYLVHSENRIKTLETEFSFGWLNTRTETPWYDPQNTSYLLIIRYNILYRLRSVLKDKINWYLGPEFNINGQFRVNYKYGNSAFTFDNYNGVGVATRFEFPFSYSARKVKIWFMNFNRRDRNLRLSWQLSTPVVSFMIRPTYVTITNFIDPDLQTKITSENTDGGFFVPLNIRSQTELFYELHNQNMFKLSYIWNFYNHDPGYNKVQSAYHGFLFSFIFKFNNKVSQ
ncbi:MAG: hypothetical protein R2750_11150 [Bacteroidales bacterium]